MSRDDKGKPLTSNDRSRHFRVTPKATAWRYLSTDGGLSGMPPAEARSIDRLECHDAR